MPSSEQDLTELGRSRPASQDPVATTTDNFPGSSLQRQTERLATGDPRLSIAERYKNDGQHVSQVARAADRLVRQRLLLEEDAAAVITEAAESDFGK